MSTFPPIPPIHKKDRYVNVELTNDRCIFYRTLNKSQYSDYTKSIILDEQNKELSEFVETYFLDELDAMIPKFYDSHSSSDNTRSTKSPTKRKEPDTPPNTGQGNRTGRYE